MHNTSLIQDDKTELENNAHGADWILDYEFWIEDDLVIVN